MIYRKHNSDYRIYKAVEQQNRQTGAYHKLLNKRKELIFRVFHFLSRLSVRMCTYTETESSLSLHKRLRASPSYEYIMMCVLVSVPVRDRVFVCVRKRRDHHRYQTILHLVYKYETYNFMKPCQLSIKC